MKRPGRGTIAYVAMTATLTVMAFLVVTHLRTSRTITAESPVLTRNIYAMATRLREERDARRALEAQVTELRRQLETYERTAAEGRSLTEAMGKELESLRLALGLKAMRGPGVVVTLADAKAPSQSSNPVVVTYQDIVAVVNELWAAGAEAVAVNGQRISGTTGFSQIGGTVAVNLQRLNPPFEIAAIGDPKTLEGALSIRGGLVEGLRALGLQVLIQRRDQITVPAFRGSLSFEFAQPAE